MDSTDIHALPEPADGSHVYFIQPAGGGLVKIGVASDLRRRLRNLQHMSPVRLNLLAVMPGDKTWEEQLHYDFCDLREYGEWFQPGSDLLDFIATLEQEPIELEDLPKPPVPKKPKRSDVLWAMAESVPLPSQYEDWNNNGHCPNCPFCCTSCDRGARYADTTLCFECLVEEEDRD